MSLWPEYHSKLFVDRPQAIERVRRWADDPAAKRVLVLAAPPGSGKSWLLRKMEEEWKPKRLTAWLDAPTLIHREENRDPNRMLNQDAFGEWFEEVKKNASRFCALRPIGSLASLEAQVEALVEMVCNCALYADPILIVDAYDEITEAQGNTLCLRLLAKFISRPCTRLLIAVRSEALIQEDTLRRNQELLYLAQTDTLDQDFARDQFEKWFAQNYSHPSLPANLGAWMAGYRHYSWRNPAINHFLFSKALTNNPLVLSPLAASDLRECIQEIIQRTGRYKPLSSGEFEILYKIAVELGDTWSYLQAEKSISGSFYANKSIRRLLEMGILLWQAGLFYRVETGIRELLLEIHALTPAP